MSVCGVLSDFPLRNNKTHSNFLDPKTNCAITDFQLEVAKPRPSLGLVLGLYILLLGVLQKPKPEQEIWFEDWPPLSDAEIFPVCSVNFLVLVLSFPELRLVHPLPDRLDTL